MSRIRTIQPHFARSPSMSRVCREARLLFVLLWTIVDDDGRCRGDVDDLARVLYPSDFDALQCIHFWLDELEREDCIERYQVDDIAYLRIVHWRKHQWIGHPTPSHLPPSPHERPSDSGIPEASRRLRGRNAKAERDQTLSGQSGALPESDEIFADDESPVVVDRQTVLRDFRRIRAKAEADRSHTAALRAAELMARFGLPSDKATEHDKPRTLGPHELLRPDD